jgi:hypothetical protein
MQGAERPADTSPPPQRARCIAVWHAALTVKSSDSPTAALHEAMLLFGRTFDDRSVPPAVLNPPTRLSSIRAELAILRD